MNIKALARNMCAVDEITHQIQFLRMSRMVSQGAERQVAAMCFANERLL